MSSNLQPALIIDDHTYLSADDFQKQLCTWLQNRGMLSELRAYFKTNMIEILRNTSAGTSLGLGGPSQAPSSPKTQAINLLVAEYMSHSNLHFSLCVFGTEVTLNKVFSNGRDHYKFNQKEVLDILETLGLMRHNKQAKCISLMYQHSDEPLLYYLLPSSPVQISESDLKDVFFTSLDNDYDFGMHTIDRVLLNSNISPEEVNQLKFAIKWICDKHKEKEKQLEVNLKVDYKTQLSKYKLKMHEMERSFEAERNELKNEIAQLQRLLTEVQLKDVCQDKSNKHIQCKLEEYNVKQVGKRKNASVCTLNIQMETKATQSDFIQEERVKTKDEVNTDIQVLKAYQIENTFLRQTVDKLERENEMLRSDNRGFSKELDQLALRASTLMAELNISQQNILRLNGILHSTIDVNQPLPRIAMNQGHILSYTGAGEEYLRTTNVIPPQYRNLTKVHKRRSDNRSTSCSSTSRSPTDSIIHEAKEKLKHLEEESMIIDKKIGRIPRLSISQTHINYLPSTNKNTDLTFEFGTQIGHSENSSDDEVSRLEGSVEEKFDGSEKDNKDL